MYGSQNLAHLWSVATISKLTLRPNQKHITHYHDLTHSFNQSSILHLIMKSKLQKALPPCPLHMHGMDLIYRDQSAKN
jgi:hypothetical protein